MSGLVNLIARPLLFAFEAEQAHRLTISALRTVPLPGTPSHDPSLEVEAFGLALPRPRSAWRRVSTKAARFRTRSCASGSAMWRSAPSRRCRSPAIRSRASFRLTEDLGVINRLGFNSEGQDVVHTRLKQRAGRGGVVESMSAPTRRRPTAPAITWRESALSPMWRAISPSTCRRPIRRACAICSRPTRSTNCWRASWMRATP